MAENVEDTADRTRLLRGLSLFAVFGLALTACGDDADDEGAGSEDADAAETEEEPEEEDPGLPQAEAGTTVTSLPADVSVSSPESPEDGTVIAPGGSFSVERIATADSLPASVLGIENPQQELEDQGFEEEAAEADDPAADPEFAPADGEVFRVVDVSMAQDGEFSNDIQLAVNTQGQQSGLSEVMDDDRLLFSVPEDEEAHLVVTSEGHDQLIDLYTGERVEDEMAAAYYRDVARQDVHHSFDFESQMLGDIETSVDVSVNSAFLTPYAPADELGGDGWASEGETWLVLEWEEDAETDSNMVSTDNEVWTWTAEVDGEEYELTEDSPSGSWGSAHKIALAVPAGAEAVTLRVEVDLQVDPPGSDEGGSGTFSAEDGLEVEFPDDDGSGSDEGEDDGAEDEED